MLSVLHRPTTSNKGVNSYDKFGNDATIWYPTSGYRYGSNDNISPSAYFCSSADSHSHCCIQE